MTASNVTTPGQLLRLFVLTTLALLVCFVIRPTETLAQTTCREAVRHSDQLVQDLRKATRALGQQCQEDQSACDAAVSALNQSLTVLNESVDNELIPTCQPVMPPGAQVPGPGELVITELNVVSLYNEGAVDQWIEVFNPTAKELSLTNLNLLWTFNNAPYSGTIVEQATILPQSYKVLAFCPQELQAHLGIQGATQILSIASSQCGANVPISGGLDLASSLEISSAIDVVDAVSWLSTAFNPSIEGSVSRQLDPDAYDASVNDFVNSSLGVVSNSCPTPAPFSGQCVWCFTTLQYGGAFPGYGTPGTENTECTNVQPVP